MTAHGRQPSGVFGRALLFTVKLLLLGLLKVWFRVRVENRPRLEGGYVLVANHTSFLDPLVLGVVMPSALAPRRVIFMMTSVMARSRLLGWFYRWNKVIAVSPRGGNRAAVRAARETLAAGEVLGIFPEGGVGRDGRLLLGSSGAVALGLAKNAPVLPVGLVGVDRALPHGALFPRPRRIVVRFGHPIPAAELLGEGDRKQQLVNATTRIMQEIAALTGQTAREEQLQALRA